MAEMRAVFATAAPRLTEFPIPATVTRPDAQCRALLSFAAHCDIVFLLFRTKAALQQKDMAAINWKQDRYGADASPRNRKRNTQATAEGSGMRMFAGP